MVSRFRRTVMSTVLLGMLLAGVATGQAVLKTVVVVDFDVNSPEGQQHHLGKGLADMLTARLTASRLVTVVERFRLNEAFTALGLAAAGPLDERGALKVGTAVGADFVILGSLTDLGKTVSLDLRILGVQIQKVVGSATERGGPDDLAGMLDRLCDKVVSEIAPEGSRSPARGVSGRVTDNSGRGIEGVTLTLTGGMGTAVTDSSGCWSARDLQVVITATPAKQGWTFIPAARELSGPADDLDFTGLPENYFASGWVKDSSGRGVDGVMLTLGGGSATHTDLRGYWGMGGLEGTVAVTPTKDGWTFTPATSSVTAANPQADFSARRAVTGYVVSPTGGDFTTIAEAIREAPSGTRIPVRPGVYREALVIDKPVEIVGDGRRDQIVVETTDSTCVVIKSPTATLKGLTIGCKAPAKSGTCCGIEITMGAPLVEDCDVTSSSYCCVHVHGDGANPTISQCRIHDGGETGIVFSDKACGMLKDCDIYRNALPGLAIAMGADPLVKGCKIRDGKDCGLYVIDQGLGTVENCFISGNAKCGVIIATGGNPTIRRCHIYQNSQYGVAVLAGGAGTIESCDVTGNRWGSWYIKTDKDVRRIGNIDK